MREFPVADLRGSSPAPDLKCLTFNISGTVLAIMYFKFDRPIALCQRKGSACKFPVTDLMGSGLPLSVAFPLAPS